MQTWLRTSKKLQALSCPSFQCWTLKRTKQTPVNLRNLENSRTNIQAKTMTIPHITIDKTEKMGPEETATTISVHRTETMKFEISDTSIYTNDLSFLL